MKKEKHAIKIEANYAVQLPSDITIYYWNGQGVIQNRKQDPIKEDDKLCLTKKPRLSHVFFGPETSRVAVKIDVTVQQLRRLLQKAEKQKKRFGRGFVHLNPEVTFWVEGKLKRRREK